MDHVGFAELRMHLTGAELGQLPTHHSAPQSCVTWSSAPRSLQLRKTPTGSLGFKIKVLPFGSETVTVLYGIIPECTVQDRNLLSDYDRIVSIDDQAIVHLKDPEVKALLKSHTGPEVTLGISKVVAYGKPGSSSSSNLNLQRFHSNTSSDSGKGNSPQSGGTGNASFFHFGLLDVQSTNSSDRESLDETVRSKQSTSIKRSASGSSSLSGGTIGRKRLVYINNNNGLHVQDKRLENSPVHCNGRMAATACPDQKLVTQQSPQARHPFRLHSIKDSDLDVVHSVPEGASLSNLLSSDPTLFNDDERTQSLPLNSQPISPSEGDSLAYSICTCSCRDDSNSFSQQTTPPLDMAFDLGGPGTKTISVTSKCSSKVLPTNAKDSASCTDCLTKSQQILKYPHRVLWDPNTKVVNLQRSSKKVPLGFTFKVKMSKNKDGTAEVYTLVEQVRKGGLADGHFFVGDWIRSVDGKPLHDAKEALGMTKHLEKCESMRFVIQRPVEMKSQAGDPAQSFPDEEKSKSSSKHSSYTPMTSVMGMQAVPEDPDHCMACNYSLPPEELTSRGRNSDRSLKRERLSCGLSQGTGSNNSGKRSSPRTPPICTCPKSTISENFRLSASTISEPLDWLRLCKSIGPMDEIVKCPCLQLFIVGSHALKMVEMLLGNSRVLSNFSERERFLNIQCCVTEDLDETTKISLRDDMSENVLLNSVISQCLDTQNCVCEDDIQLDIATQSGSDLQQRCFSRLTSRSQGSSRYVVGLDIYVVLDDKFFSHCCHLVFSKSSIFLLTFDGSKVLDNTGEMRKIGQMVHSARSFSGSNTPLYLYGFLDGEGSENLSPRADELQALFYTDHGRQILRYPNVTMPNFITVKPLGVVGEDQIYAVRQLLGQHVLHQDFLHGQLHMATLPARAFIAELRQRGRATAKLGELYEGLRMFFPDIGEAELSRLVRELHTSGCIRCIDDFSSRPQSDSTALMQLVHIQPNALLQTAQSLLTGLERIQKSSPREIILSFKCPTAATKNQIIDALVSAEFNNLTLGLEFSLLFLEKLSVIQKVNMCSDVYFIPYFCIDHPNTGPNSNSEQKEHYVLFVKLDKVVSSSVFTRVILELAQICRAKEVMLECLEESTLTLDDWSVVLSHIWEKDVFKITLRSEKVNLSSHPPHGFLSHLLRACRTCLPPHIPYHVGPLCPLGEECAVNKEGQLHVVDLLQHEPLHCGQIRLDARKDVKIWLTDLKPHDKLSVRGDYLTDHVTALRVPPDPPDPGDEQHYRWSTPFLELPFTLLHNLFLQLNLPMPQGNDWTGFAGTIGKSSGEVALYQNQQNPARELLSDWARTCKATVGDLVDVLNNPDMERRDLILLVQQSLKLT